MGSPARGDFSGGLPAEPQRRRGDAVRRGFGGCNRSRWPVAVLVDSGQHLVPGECGGVLSYVPVIGRPPTPTADVPGVGPAGSDPTGPRIVLVGSPQATRNPNPGPPTRVTGGPGWSFPEHKWRSGPGGRPISKFLLGRIPAAEPIPAPANGAEGRPDAGASGSSRFTFSLDGFYRFLPLRRPNGVIRCGREFTS